MAAQTQYFLLGRNAAEQNLKNLIEILIPGQ